MISFQAEDKVIQESDLNGIDADQQSSLRMSFMHFHTRNSRCENESGNVAEPVSDFSVADDLGAGPFLRILRAHKNI